jgi:hypothetical protein
MKFKYEPPKLISLNGERSAMGNTCCNGSSVDYYCSDGGCPTNDCSNGTSAGFFCTTGNVAAQKCCTGNSPGWTYNCWPGNCPVRPQYCAYGGTYCQAGNNAGVGDPPCS